MSAAFAKQENQENTYGFKLGDYNKNEELIIDPLVAVFSTYLGGNDEDRLEAIAVGGDGSVYVAGAVSSVDYPTANAIQGTIGGYSKFSKFCLALFFCGSVFMDQRQLPEDFKDFINFLNENNVCYLLVGGKVFLPDFI